MWRSLTFSAALVLTGAGLLGQTGGPRHPALSVQRSQSCLASGDSAARYCPLDQHPREVVGDGVRVEFLSLDMRDPQVWVLHAKVTNTGTDSLVLGAEVLARVGAWFRRANMQRQTVLALSPRGSRDVDLMMLIPGYSIDASVRVRFGHIEGTPPNSRLTDVLIERTYALGDSPWSRQRMAHFADSSGRYVTAFVRRGWGVERHLSDFVRIRDSAVSAVATFLDVAPRSGIRLVVYPDGLLKWLDTGHSGAGWAFDSTIVEVAGEARGMDPFHEVTHILARRLGAPPALFNEGLAVYAGERLGGDALAFLGYGERRIPGVMCELDSAQALLGLEELLSFTAIGDEETRPTVSYPEAASVVGYLVERFGMERFRSAFHNLQESDSLTSNRAAFAQVFGSSLASIETDWRAHVRAHCAGPPPR